MADSGGSFIVMVAAAESIGSVDNSVLATGFAEGLVFIFGGANAIRGYLSFTSRHFRLLSLIAGKLRDCSFESSRAPISILRMIGGERARLPQQQLAVKSHYFCTNTRAGELTFNQLAAGRTEPCPQFGIIRQFGNGIG